jgi:hypothetical protein
VIVVIQCAASKAHGAGHLLTPAGVPVTFVADPEMAPMDDERVYPRPDDDCGSRTSWRDALVDYNKNPGGNRLGLLSAYRLYANPAYQRLVDKLGIASVYIRSAGWGLIRGDFLTPYYDITFSASARGDDAYKRRRKADRYEDFRMLPDETADEVLLFGGKDYIPLFCNYPPASRADVLCFRAPAIGPMRPAACWRSLRQRQGRTGITSVRTTQSARPQFRTGVELWTGDCRARGKVVGWELPTAATETK